nr:MMPL family transporter [Galbitalea soli]
MSALVTRRPWVVIGVWIAIVAGAAVIASGLDGSLKAGGFTNPRAEALVTQATLRDAFDEAPGQLVVALDSTKPVTDGMVQTVITELRRAGATTTQDASTHPDWRSSSGCTTLVVGGFDADDTTVQNSVPDLQRRLESALRGQSASGSHSAVYVTGQPALDYQLNVHSKADATRAEMIVFPVLIIVLLLVFGSVTAMIVPLLIAGSALALGSAAGALLGRGIDLSILYSNIVSMIGLAVAIDYSLFIIKRFREELAMGAEVRAAVQTAMQTAGRSVFFSGIAVAVALAALFIPRVMAFTSIALGGIVVTTAALLVTLTVLPAVLTVLGRRIDWGSIRGRRRLASASTSTHLGAGASSGLFRHPGLVTVVGVVALVIVALPISGISLQSPVASATVLPSTDPARKGLDVLAAKLGDRALFPVQVVMTASPRQGGEALLRDVATVSEFAADQRGAGDLTSVATLGAPNAAIIAAADAPESSSPLAAAVHRLWSTHNGRTVTRILIDPSEGPDSVSAHRLVTALRDRFGATANGSTGISASLAVAGATAQGVDFDSTLVDSMPLIALLVFALTFGMLLFAFRSVLLPVLALAFNGLVVAASLGILTFLLDRTGSAPINSVTPVLLFAVLFGLSMDYMVIIMARITEGFRSGLDYRAAVGQGVHATRTMVNSAAIIMIAVFASFATAEISIVREIGIGLAVAVAIDALVIRAVILPATLLLLGPRTLGASAQRANARARQRPSVAPRQLDLVH